jgi:signal transduction histidine kinase
VLEALQNAAKYAHASCATVRLLDNGTTLSFEVTDDGIGFDPDTVIRGAGLANINDRLDALGGTVSLHSSIGHGTTLRGEVPLAVVVPG